MSTFMLISLGICFTAILGDKILSFTKNIYIRATIDSCTHSFIGLLSWALVIVLNNANRNFIISKRFEIIFCAVIASFVDIDHFISAKSFNLKDAMSLKKRPFLHCTSLWILLYFIILTYSKIRNSSLMARWGVLLLTAGLSHHLRDAVRRGLWFYPLGHTPPLQWFLYIGSLATLPYYTVYLLPNTPHKNETYMV